MEDEREKRNHANTDRHQASRELRGKGDPCNARHRAGRRKPGTSAWGRTRDTKQTIGGLKDRWAESGESAMCTGERLRELLSFFPFPVGLLRPRGKG